MPLFGLPFPGPSHASSALRPLAGLASLALVWASPALALQSAQEPVVAARPSAPAGPLQTATGRTLEPLPEASLFAAALAARMAGTGDDPSLAAEAYERVWLASSGDTDLLRQAVGAWLDAGQVARAARLAGQLEPQERSGAAALVLAGQQLHQRRWRQVPGALDGAAFEALEQSMAGLMRAGAAASVRDWATALAPTDQTVGSRGTDRALIASRGLVLEQAGRRDDAIVAYTMAWNSGLRTVGVSWLKARAEAAAGRWELASQTLSEGLSTNGATPPLVALQSALASRRLPGLPRREQTASWGLFLLGEALASDVRGPSPVPALSLALYLAPQLDEARAPLSAWLVMRGRSAEAEARLAEVDRRSPYFVDAVTARAWLLQRAGQTEDAEALLRDAMGSRDDLRLVETKAYFDLAASRHEPARAGFTRLIGAAAAPDASAAGRPVPQGRQLALLHYSRALASQGLDRWDDAEADFRQALDLDPRNPVFLNGLGYGLADRGLKLDEAVRLLRLAVRLDPRNGAILDSLGWALVQAGDYPNAVIQLERAAALLPASAEVLDHLGDAYWRLGRQEDARIEWRKALGLRPDAQRRAALDLKLAEGLPPASPAAVRQAQRDARL